jgi:acetyl esterase/lipase
LHVDPARIGGYGYSAGAHLVGLLATTSAADGLDEVAGAPDSEVRLKAAVLGAAPVDLQQFIPNPAMIRLLGAWPDERPDVYAMASPLNFVSPDDPPIFLFHGTSDWMVDVSQSRLMRDALRRAGVPAGYFEVPGGHVSTFLFDEGQVSHAIDFLDRWLACGPDADGAAVTGAGEAAGQRADGACPAK